MALFGSLGPLISTGLNVLGVLGGGTSVGRAAQLGSTAVSMLTMPTSRSLPAGGPTIGQMVPGEIRPAMAAAPSVGAGSLMIFVQQLLIKMASHLGLRTLSLKRALKIMRRLGRFLEPVALAGVIGLTTAEMATLIMADSTRPRRRMNAANAKALRRAHRRVEAFHRLCVRNDQLRGGRRRSVRRSASCPPGTVIRQG